MKRKLLLTSALDDDDKILVNLDFVVAIEWDSANEQSTVIMNGQDDYEVKESAVEIDKMINKLNDSLIKK